MKTYENLSIQVGQPFRRKRFKSTFEDKRLKEGGCHETIYKSGIIEIPDTAKTESRERRSVLDEKSVKKKDISQNPKMCTLYNRIRYPSLKLAGDRPLYANTRLSLSFNLSKHHMAAQP